MHSHTQTALLILPEFTAREFLSPMLRQLGYHVQHARNGLDGINLHEGYPGRIDLVIADLHLAELTVASLGRFLTRRRNGFKVLYWSSLPVEPSQPVEDDRVIRPFTTSESLAEKISAAPTGAEPAAFFYRHHGDLVQELIERANIAMLTAEVTTLMNSPGGLHHVL